MENDRALLDEARDELGHQFDGDEGTFTEEEVVTYAQEHFLTVAKVNERLEPRYQEHGNLTLNECWVLCEKYGVAKALPVIRALEALANLAPSLPDADREIYDLIEGQLPFGVMITLGSPDGLMHEVYADYEQMIWQSGMDFQPTFALAFDPDEPEILEMLRDALVACGLVLEETNTLLYTLEALS